MSQENSISVVLKNIAKHFGKVKVLDQLDITFKAGMLTTLLGPSGCGKTTLLRLVSGLEAPTSGEILFGDENVTKLSATHRDVGMVFQSYALFPHMNVEKNIAYGLNILKRDQKTITEMVDTALATVNLEGYQKRYPDELSGGQQQRVAVARALVLKPKVLLFDEPLSNIDSKLRRSMRDDIRQLQQQTGITSIYVTHDQAEALSVSDEVVVMREGVIEQHGAPRDLYRRPQSAFVANFIGESNIVDAMLEKVGDTFRIKLGEATIDLPENGAATREGPTRLSLRPEMFMLKEEGDPQTAVAGKILQSAYMGPVVEYNIKTAVGEIFTTAAAIGKQFNPGDRIFLHFHPEELIILPEET
ncbi:MAG: ATP-binding cassette domain-containing protein [Thermodesulfobacteriota bacterium]